MCDQFILQQYQFKSQRIHHHLFSILLAVNIIFEPKDEIWLLKNPYIHQESNPFKL
jgi:hypothetical protein